MNTSIRLHHLLLGCLLTAATAQEVPVPTGESRVAGDITGKKPPLAFGLTEWGRSIDPTKVLPEYPRPQLVRKDWLNLNGHWDYALAPREAARPANFDGKILVPFPLESELSGVQVRIDGKNRLWYRRGFEVPAAWKDRRVMLNFGAVDWEAEVMVNGKAIGKHQGGYDPFSFDITDALTKDGRQEVVIAVWDPTEMGQPHGKQKLSPGPIEYTPCSGIWQTVWLEPVAEGGIGRVKMTPDIEAKKLQLMVSAGDGAEIAAIVKAGGKEIARANGKANATLDLKIPSPRVWWPHDPFLYDLEVFVRKDGKVIDRATSYFGMRKCSLGPDEKGITRMLLNDRFILHHGVLDQGYWPDGIYTAPTDEALRHDIEMIRKLGFNMSRKHLKVEPARWYHWADKLGLLVWQDMPSANGLQRTDIAPGMPELVGQYELEMRRMIDSLYNHPSIVSWVLFNEGLGIKAEFPMNGRSKEILRRMTVVAEEADPTRLINHESGAAGMELQGKNPWDIGLGDIIDFHCYFTKTVPVPTKERASVIGEYGYKPFLKLVDDYVPQITDPGISGLVYTQITDVENEKNGLLDYHRREKADQPVNEVAKKNADLFSEWMGEGGR